ncbi:hypothetical protein BDZ97DRAFT_1755032 [Flammula alnicola]|nr:hypothetical protein BDZ97DRAFT_1755032 [Flammula alnicola]
MTNPISNQAMDTSLGHHVHSDEELLPGSRGAAPTVDYSPDAIEHAKLPPSEEGETQNFQPHEGAHHHTHTHEHFKGHDDATGSRCGEETNLPESKTSTAPVPAYVGPTTEKRDFTTPSSSSSATNPPVKEEPHLPETKTSTAPVPADVGPTPPKKDFTAPPSSSSAPTPTVNPSLGNKIIGKTEELVGKIIHDPKLQVKGEHSGFSQGYSEITTIQYINATEE